MVRFLWDAHNCEEAREEEELVVSTPYIEHWADLIDLWYLGMQVSLDFWACKSVIMSLLVFWNEGQSGFWACKSGFTS